MTKRYEHFRGALYYAVRTGDGAPAGYKFLGDAPMAKIAIDEKYEEHMESTSGLNRMDNYYPVEEKLTLELEIDQVENETFSLLFCGGVVGVASGTIASPIALGTVAVGDFVPLGRRNLTNLVLTDSAGTPTTLTAGTHYRIADAATGLIQILSLSGLTQPINYAADYGAESVIPFLTEPSAEIAVFGNLVNLAKQHEKVGLTIYRVRLNRPSEYMVIGEKVKLKVKGMILEDPVMAEELDGGPYMKKSVAA
jgi:hypothetical protein